LPTTSRLASTAREVPVQVAVSASAPGRRCDALAALGCEIIRFPDDEGRIPIGSLLDDLGRRGATNVLVEGGSRILGAFLDAREIDAVDVYVAPILEGGTQSPSAILGLGVSAMADAFRLEHHEVTIVDGDVRIQGTLQRAGRWATNNDSA
jgi:diaminohydroxyphosphoribosylaminopyrimidine deaminase/5-amino-6-(5-phosphoribosylamino)uracil reductase